MSALGLAECKTIAADLVAAGVRAGTDPRNLAPPMILLTPPPTLDRDFGCGSTARMQAVCIAPGPGQEAAWAQLEHLYEVLARVVPVESAQLAQWDGGGDQLPALEVFWQQALPD